jgi:hypothetical protein
MGVGVEDGHGSWSFDWRPKRTVAVEDTPRRWGDESRRGQAPAMGSNFGKIGPSVAELWASAAYGGSRLFISFDSSFVGVLLKALTYVQHRYL